MTPIGPFETASQARTAAHFAVPPPEGSSILTAEGNRKLLGRALEAAGVEMGRYDDRIAEWLAGFEDAICAVVAGWVSRAHAAGLAAVRDDGSDKGGEQ